VAVTVSVKSHAGDITAASVVARDITDRKRLEENSDRHRNWKASESWPAVSHMISIICWSVFMGNASLALGNMSESNTDRQLLSEVVRASERAADLTSQLLAYAGRGEFTIEPVSLPETARKMTKLLQSSIPSRVDLRFDIANNVPPVAGDPSQIQQVLMNLIINAAEAIGENEGVILVSIRPREIEQPVPFGDFGGGPIASGRHVVIEVRDTGCGMNDDTKSRVFDPFFTTKFMGRGLGLAAVLGIVRRHKGSINVHSVLGRGTTFEVVLPAKEECIRPSKSTPLPGDPSATGPFS
jgi:signal transduction histidine kinase